MPYTRRTLNLYRYTAQTLLIGSLVFFLAAIVSEIAWVFWTGVALILLFNTCVPMMAFLLARSRRDPKRDLAIVRKRVLWGSGLGAWVSVMEMTRTSSAATSDLPTQSVP